MQVTVDGMSSKEGRAVSYRGTLKVVKDTKLSPGSEALIGYTVCGAFVHFFIIILILKSQILLKSIAKVLDFKSISVISSILFFSEPALK